MMTSFDFPFLLKLTFVLSLSHPIIVLGPFVSGTLNNSNEWNVSKNIFRTRGEGNKQISDYF